MLLFDLPNVIQASPSTDQRYVHSIQEACLSKSYSYFSTAIMLQYLHLYAHTDSHNAQHVWHAILHKRLCWAYIQSNDFISFGLYIKYTSNIYIHINLYIIWSFFLYSCTRINFWNVKWYSFFFFPRK